MTIDDVLFLSKSKTCTIEYICSVLHSKLQLFVNKQENIYLEELKKSSKAQSSLLLSKTVDEIADDISTKVKQDSKKFIEEYVSNLIDEILDAINKNEIEESPAHIFITILCSLRELNEP